MGTGGFRIGTVRGLPVRVHFSFVVVLPLLPFLFARAPRGAAAIAGVPLAAVAGTAGLWGVGVALAWFASVLVHELAHALYAVRHGAHVQSVTMLMIGGVSQLGEPPLAAREEAAIALAGPLVSLGLGVACYVLHGVAPRAFLNLRLALFTLGSVNVFLGTFNLLPALPMDGGRVLRALLTRRLGVMHATAVAARLGKALAVLIGAWGFLSSNLLLVLIAFFVFVGAEAETRGVIVRALLGDLAVRDVMSPATATVADDRSLEEVLERMRHERRTALVVTTSGRPVGLLTLDIVTSLSPDLRARTTAGEIARRMLALSPSDDASKALRLMSQTDAPQLTVVADGHLVGTIAREDIVRRLELGELEATPHRHRRWA